VLEPNIEIKNLKERIVGIDVSSVLQAKKQSKLFSKESDGQTVGFGVFLARVSGWLFTKPLYLFSWLLNIILKAEKILLFLRVDTLQLFYWGRGNVFAIFVQAIFLFIFAIVGFMFIVGNTDIRIAKEYGIKSVTPIYAATKKDVIIESGSLTTLLPKALKRLDTADYVVTYADTLEDDTLAAIAEKWDITADSIRWANNFSKKYQPKSGKTIKIPPISGSYYTVQENENLEIIAARNNIDQATVAEVNFLAPPYKLKKGDKILLPGIAPRKPKPKKKVYAQVGFNLKGGGGSYTPPNTGTFLDWPVIGGNGGEVSRCFYGAAHNGIDINPRGTGNANPTLVAAAPGRVTYAGVHCSPGMPYKSVCGGYAWVVEIDHGNGYSTIYGHMQANSVMVRAGQAVERKQPIGKMGATGTVFGNPGTHVHFQVNSSGFLGVSRLRAANPAPLLFKPHGCR